MIVMLCHPRAFDKEKRGIPTLFFSRGQRERLGLKQTGVRRDHRANNLMSKGNQR